MKKAICLVLVMAFVLFASALPCYSAESGGYGGGHGGYSGGHGGYSGGHNWGHDHGYFRGHIWIGPGWGSWWWWGPGYPYYYPYYYYPYFYAEPSFAEPPTYVQPPLREEEEYYWYFCPDSKNYYPYVKKCPGGWLRVVPPQSPPDWEE